MNAKKIIHFAIGPLGSAALGLLTVPLLTIIFSVEDIGKFNFFQIILSFSLLMIMMGLDQSYVREFHESSDRAKLLKNCVIPGFALFSLMLTGTFFFRTEISNLLYGDFNPVLYWITLATVAATFISRFLSLILRMQERGLAFSLSQIIPKILLLAFLGAFLIFDLARSFTELLLAFFASSISVTLVYLWNTRKQWRPALEKETDSSQLKSLLQFGVPLIFSGLAYWGLMATSSFSLRSMASFSELGIYSVTNSIAGVANIFQSIFSVVWAPIVYKWVAQGVDLSRVDRLAHQALAVVCSIFIACGMFSWLCDYILPDDYALVKYLVLGAIVQPLLYTLSEITCVGIGITRRTSLTIWVTIAALLVNVTLSIWLVPKFGARGAVIANAFAYLAFFIARTEASAYAWRPFPRLRLYIFTLLLVIFSAVTVALGPTLSFHYSLLWIFLIPIVAWCFKGEFSEFYTTLKKIIAQKRQKKQKIKLE